MANVPHIVLGITGSIAAYKACTLVRLLVKAGMEVQVVMTPAAKEFVTPLTLATLSRRAVVSEFFDRRDGSWHSHVNLGEWADLMLIAPATASTLAGMACGLADNMLLTTYLSMKAPVVVAPAMDLDMYAHPATQHNLYVLRERGVRVIEPCEGELASQLHGKGRMEEPERIAELVQDLLSEGDQPLRGHHALVTAGPTYERIDPVRFIGNYSTGKMGLALCEALARSGAEVTLVAGPTALRTRHPRIKRVDVESAEQMYDACREHWEKADIGVLSAAVADFTPAEPRQEKTKRGADDLVLRLRPTRDIAAALGEAKRSGQRLVGFALETQNERENARSKLLRKHLDMIVLNSLRDAGAGFGGDTNKVCLISKSGQEEQLPLMSKAEVAQHIVEHIVELL